MAVAAIVREVAATGVAEIVATMPVRVSIMAVNEMAMMAVPMWMVPVVASVERRTVAWYHDDWRGVTKNHPRKWR